MATTRTDRGVAVIAARRDILSTVVPEGAEDNLEALQHAADRLETDEMLVRGELLAIAARCLKRRDDDDGGGRLREAAVATALADMAPPGERNVATWHLSDAVCTSTDAAIAATAAALRDVHLEWTANDAAARRLAAFAAAERHKSDVDAFVAAGAFDDAATALASLRASVEHLECAATPESDAHAEVRASDRTADLRRAAEATEAALTSRLLTELDASLVVGPGRSVRARQAAAIPAVWRALRRVHAQTAAAAAATLGDRLARGFVVPMLEAAGGGMDVTVHVRNESAPEEAGADPGRVLSWHAASTSGGATDGRDAARMAAAGLETVVRFLANDAGFAEAPGLARTLGAALWPEVAAAITATWLAPGTAADVADEFDEAANALCAAEEVAASFGLVPPPPRVPRGDGAAAEVEVGWPGGALGPIEAAARERERTEADEQRGRVLAAARDIITEGERDRATCRAYVAVGDPGRTQSAPTEDEAGRSATDDDNLGPFTPSPPCTVSLAATRFSRHVTAVLAEAAAAAAAAPRSARALASAAADCLDLHRAVLPTLRGGNILDGGFIAAVVFRNDAHHLAASWCAAVYAYGSAFDGLGLMWPVAPLVEAGDRTLEELVERCEAEINAALDDTRGFRDVGERDSNARAVRATRRAKHVVARAAAATLRHLPAPLGIRTGARLAGTYAARVVKEALALDDVSVDEAEALREIMLEAFAVAGWFPPASSDEFGDAESTVDARREAADEEAAEVVDAIPGCEWLKGAEVASLLETPMADIASGWESGRLPALGFTREELRGFLAAVFEDTPRREEALARIM